MNMNYWLAPATCRAEVDKPTKIKKLIERVCKSYEITEKQLRSKRRLSYIVEPRKVVMYILHKEYGISSTEVGVVFGKTHATVLSACKSIEGFMQFDRDFRNRINYLK